MLEQLFADYDQGRVRLSQTFDADGASVLQSACKMGLEGVIAKRLNAPYRSARTDAWLKVKCQLRQEFVIGGFTVRSGAGREIGSLLLGGLRRRWKASLRRKRRHGMGFGNRRSDPASTGEARSLRISVRSRLCTDQGPLEQARQGQRAMG